MKTPTMFLALGLSVIGLGNLPQTQADSSWSVGISVSQVRDFDEPLGSYGYWVDLPAHGRCWYPAYIGRDWRPYGAGHWEWTDQGWYWVSDEPWGWATYHYGRWVYDSYYGWVWVPGTEWAPAWVSWREGGGYIGWAPLPPTGYFGPTGILVVEHIHYQPAWWVFVEHRHFSHRHRPATVIVNNTTIINKTVNITKVEKVVNNNTTVIINNGPDIALVEKSAPQKIQRVAAADLWRERSERVTQRASREGVKPPPLASTPPVGLRVARPAAAAGAVAKPATEPRPRARDRDEEGRGSLPPAITRPIVKPETPTPQTPKAEITRETPRIAPGRDTASPGQVRKQEKADEDDKADKDNRRDSSPVWRRPAVIRPTPAEPVTPPSTPPPEPPRRQVAPELAPTSEPVPRVEPRSQERWQERLRELQERERDRRPVFPAPAPAPRNENSGNFFGGQALPPARPAPAATTPATESTDSKTDGKDKDKDKDKDPRADWEQFRELKRKR